MQNKPAKRPIIISVVGYLNIVIGAMGVLGILCCGVPFLFIDQIADAIPTQKGQPNPMGIFVEMNKVPGYFAFASAGQVVGGITSSLLLASGIGFLKMKKWGRTAGFLYSIIGILWAIAAAFALMKLNPGLQEATKKWQAQFGQPNVQTPLDNPAMQQLQAILTMLGGFAFPVVVLILMLLPAVKYGLVGKGDPAWEAPADDLDPGHDPDETIAQ